MDMLAFSIMMVIMYTILIAFCVMFVMGVGGFDWSVLFEGHTREKPRVPKSLEPMLNAPNNRDFVIEMLKLRKETLKKYGYDPFCSVETADEIVAAEKVANALEFLVNKYPDPDGFNRALTSTGLINYVTKFNTNKEN